MTRPTVADGVRRRIAVVFGTRPEMIKLAPVIRELGEQAVLVHTGQHYDSSMSATFLRQLRLGEPDYRLTVGGLSRGAQIGEGTVAIEQLLLESDIGAVIVQGDTNAGVAGALAANSVGIPLVHLEAGLRSFDRRMPEECNRIIIDALSDLCCAPHEDNARQLEREGVAADRIAVTGSTLYEIVIEMLPDPDERRLLLESLAVPSGTFVLATVHRAENVDDPARLSLILRGLDAVNAPVVLPLHPRTCARVREFGLEHLLEGLSVIEPLGYPEFLAAAAECAVLISDSGGVQEEAAVLKRPVVIVRDSTERPELVGTFAHLSGGDALADIANGILADLDAVRHRLDCVSYPYERGGAVEAVRRTRELLGSTR